MAERLGGVDCDEPRGAGEREGPDQVVERESDALVAHGAEEQAVAAVPAVLGLEPRHELGGGEAVPEDRRADGDAHDVAPDAPSLLVEECAGRRATPGRCAGPAGSGGRGAGRRAASTGRSAGPGGRRSPGGVPVRSRSERFSAGDALASRPGPDSGGGTRSGQASGPRRRKSSTCAEPPSSPQSRTKSRWARWARGLIRPSRAVSR